MTITSWATCLVASASLAALSVSAASATPCTIQNGAANCDLVQDIGVTERTRPAYDAKGIPMGGFRLFPSVDLAATYDDNVFRLPASQSDTFFTVSPSVRLQSQWGRHFFEIYGGLNYYDYSKFSRLNLTDWKVGSDGRLDLSRATVLSAAVFYGQMHEALSSPNTVGFQLSPNRFNQTHFNVDASYQPNRLGVAIGGVYDNYRFSNTPSIGGGFINNADRDESEYQAYGKVYYDFSPGYSGFVRGSYDSRQFDQFFDRSGLHRSSDGYRINGGLDFEITHLMKGQVFIGYLQQNFSHSVPIPLKDVSGLDYGVGVDWFATENVTVHLNGARTLSDVTLAGVSVAEDSNIKLSVDYEFRYNILANAYVSYTDSSYIGTTRSDSSPGAGIGVRYLMNRYLSADLNYNYSKRSSNLAGFGFNDDMISLDLTGHL